MITPTETEVFAELERLAASCPWEKVDIWVVREPSGHISFTAYAAGNETLGFNSAFGSGLTPCAAVDALLKANPGRGQEDIEQRRQEQIAKLRMEIARLETISFELPPYRPTPLIGHAPRLEPVPAGEQVINI